MVKLLRASGEPACAGRGEDMEAVDAKDTADTIQETTHKVSDEGFRKLTAVAIGVLAMLLAISSLGGQNATKEMINSNIHATDTWAFFQAKNIRQTSYQLANDELEAFMLAQPNLPAQARADIQRRIERNKATIARYESEPSTGEGKKELAAKASAFERRRDHAFEQDPNFDFSQALFQIAIVLSSVSIVASARWLLWAALTLGTFALLLMVNGFLLLVHLPGA